MGYTIVRNGLRVEGKINNITQTVLRIDATFSMEPKPPENTDANPTAGEHGREQDAVSQTHELSLS